MRNPANSIQCFLVQVDTPDQVIDVHVHGYSVDDVLETFNERYDSICKITHIRNLVTQQEESYYEEPK